MNNEKKKLLIQKLKYIKKSLQISNGELDNLKATIKNSIMINDEVIDCDNINSIKRNIELVRNELNDVVIPRVEDSIE